MPKREKDIDTNECAPERTGKNADTARRELKGLRAQVGVEKKKITELGIEEADFKHCQNSGMAMSCV